MAELRIGTSGWTYSSWKGKFYPADLKSSDFLGFYSNHFNTTEVNYSFYHLPKTSTYAKWASQVPENFLFALKASRYISHTKKLQDISLAWRTFVEHANALGSNLGPILIQLPASFHLDRECLERFLHGALDNSAKLKLVFEFRHSSWFIEEVYELLAAHNAAFCIADSSRYPRYDIATADFVYYRFHGPEALFASGYSKSALKAEATKMHKYIEKGLDIFAFFNNDAKGHAVQNAQTLIQLLEKDK